MHIYILYIKKFYFPLYWSSFIVVIKNKYKQKNLSTFTYTFSQCWIIIVGSVSGNVQSVSFIPSLRCSKFHFIWLEQIPLWTNFAKRLEYEWPCIMSAKKNFPRISYSLEYIYTACVCVQIACDILRVGEYYDLCDS